MKWKVKKLNDVCIRITKGTTPTTLGYAFTTSGINFIKAESITQDGRIDTDKFSFIDDKTNEALKRSQLQERDVLISIAGMFLGKTSVLKGEHLPANTNQAVGIIRVDETLASPYFIHYLFQHPYTKAYVNSVNGQAAQPNINLKQIGDIEFQFPPFELQVKIAGILKAYDDLIENNLRRIRLLAEAARCRFKLLAEEKKSFSKKIAELGHVITGKTPSTSRKDFYNGDILFVKTPDMHNQVYVMDTDQRLSGAGAESQANKFVPENSVMVSCIGTAGVVSLASKSCQTNQQINTVVPYNPCHSFILYFAFQEKRSELEALGSSGATFTNVSKTKFENIFVQVPSDKDAEDFHRCSEPVFELIKSLYKQNALLGQARDILLPRLMSGEIDVSSLTIPDVSIAESSVGIPA